MERRKRPVTGYLCFLFLAALLCFGILFTEQMQRADALEAELFEYRRYLQNEAESAARDLGSSLEELERSLGKLTAAATPAQHAKLLAEVRRLSDAAGGALGRLSASHTDTKELGQFLARTGDYAGTLFDSVQGGTLLSAADAAQLDAIGAQCRAVRGAWNDRIEAGTLPSGTVSADGFYTAERSAAALPAYPTLVYEGRLSESSETAAARGLPKETVTETQAAAAAARAFPGTDWHFDGRCEADPVTFDFSGPDGESLSITERGGRVLYWMTVPQPGDPIPDDALDALYGTAAAYARNAGFADFRPVLSTQAAGTLAVRLVPVEEGVLLYPDAVTVYLDGASQRVVGFDAREYYRFHTERWIPPFRLTAEDAQNAVTPDMTVATVQKCVLQKCPTSEVFCWECRGTVGDAEYLVYLNAGTGAEEAILAYSKTESGEYIR